jgi:hypothetical protein
MAVLEKGDKPSDDIKETILKVAKSVAKTYVVKNKETKAKEPAKA